MNKTKNQYDPITKDDLKIEDNLKNEDNLKVGDNTIKKFIMLFQEFWKLKNNQGTKQLK